MTARTVIEGRRAPRSLPIVAGEVLTPTHPQYAEARRVHNGRIDRRPALVVRCAGTSDVAAAIRFAREHALPLAVRCGGHSAAGFGTCDGGLVVDLSRMKSIHVDPRTRRARIEGGVTWGDLDAATREFDLATTGGRISSIGVAGMTLGGGYGWLMRKHGLAADNLRWLEVVTANSETVVASATENPELFWGLRGGGGNFGVVTSLEFGLHPIPPAVTAGMAFFPVERTAELLAFFRELLRSTTDDLGAMFNLLLLPHASFVPEPLQGRLVAAIPVCHVGPLEAAERDLAPLRRLDPLLDRIRPMPYAKLQRMFDVAGAIGHHCDGRAGHLVDLSAAVIDVVAEHAARITSPLSIVMISALGGAVARTAESATAFSHRQTWFDCSLEAVWDPADSPERHLRWVREFWNDLRPFTTGVYVNELRFGEEQRVREAYSPATYSRLAALKAVLDPDNVFKLNHNVSPLAIPTREDHP